MLACEGGWTLSIPDSSQQKGGNLSPAPPSFCPQRRVPECEETGNRGNTAVREKWEQMEIWDGEPDPSALVCEGCYSSRPGIKSAMLST